MKQLFANNLKIIIFCLFMFNLGCQPDMQFGSLETPTVGGFATPSLLGCEFGGKSYKSGDLVIGFKNSESENCKDEEEEFRCVNGGFSKAIDSLFTSCLPKVLSPKVEVPVPGNPVTPVNPVIPVTPVDPTPNMDPVVVQADECDSVWDSAMGELDPKGKCISFQ